ncbi:MAG: hypothetical protein ABSH38_14780 [Verrucomicrobiota bacterium]|jgi:hypothetical protein
MSPNTGPGQNIAVDTPANVAQRGPSAGARVPAVEIFHTNLGDSLTYSSAYTATNAAFPGITLDLRPSGQPFYGNDSSDPEVKGAPAGATIHLQDGAGGTLKGSITISIGMLNGKTHKITLREIDSCQIVDGVLTPGYRLIVCSEFYTTSIA